MRQAHVILGKKVHDTYKPNCSCKLNNEAKWREVVKCARKTLLQQAQSLLNQLSHLGYTNTTIALEVNHNPSITCRAHAGGAELQLGLDKLFSLVQSLEKYLERARLSHFNMSIGTHANIAPYDYCHSLPVISDDLRDKAAKAVQRNLAAIFLARPLSERCQLPDGMEGVVSDFGDPAYGITVIQVESTEELKRLKLQLHEIKHVEERLEAKIRRLERMKNAQKLSDTPRAQFS